LRTEKSRFSSSDWKLFNFYRAITYPAIEKQGKATESEWQKHLGSMKKWVNQSPGSITARVALASALMDYAAVKERQGNQTELTEEEKQLYQERVSEVEQILNEAGKISERCPHWYYLMLDIAYAKGWDIERYDQIFNEAIKFEQLYEQLYIRKIYYLKKIAPKGAVEKFADEIYAKLGGKEGQRMYYVITAVQALTYGIDVFDQTELSWDKVVEGYNASNELFGECTTRLNYFCYLATAAHDINTVRKTMKRIGPNVDTRIWGNAKYYGKVKDWAFKGCND
jgi:hypothetical protein